MISEKFNFLPIGETSNGNICPYCGGGFSRDRSFSITRVLYGYLFKCHRASCSEAGFERCVDFVPPPENKSRENKKKREVNLRELSDNHKELLYKKYELDYDILNHYGVKFDLESNRVYYPMYSSPYVRLEVGFSLRGYNGEQPKTLTELTSSEASGGGFYGEGGTTIIIVEDPASGIKLAKLGLTSFVLFGTHINYKKLANIVNEGFTHALYSLDWDARDKALMYQKEYGCFFASSKVMFAKRDIKDTPLKELEKIYGTILNSGSDTRPESI